MNQLRLTLIQSRVHWHRPEDNRALFQRRIDALEEPGDVIILPETFASGFTQSPQQCAETMDGETVRWMRRCAKATGAVITGSLAVAENDAYYNRMLWVTPEGDLSWYDKRHLFRMAGEHRRYSPGHDRVVVGWRGWRICLQVCYDLRFPVWTRNRDDYDLLLFVANWPTPRRQAWNTLLKARAIENQCYVVGLNRVGEDGNGMHYAGDSAAVDFLGSPLVELGDRECSVTVSLELEPLERFRQEFPFHQDADRFRLE